MSAAKLKGSLLEYAIRRILLNCGFSRVKPDGLLIFERGGLTMINGKGAAHDADVLMTPPIQMPFSYPSRINFECKAYKRRIGLSVIRNALGLRYDINEFEIVTRRHLLRRQNNHRNHLALDNRQRYNYQVGVASVENFTKDAFEFAANNKIPLISLRWFLPQHICDLFHEITPEYIQLFSDEQIYNLLQFFKGNPNEHAEDFLRETDSIFREIYNALLDYEKNVLIALLESGDLLFLLSRSEGSVEYLSDNNRLLSARFYYYRQELDYWILEINQSVTFGFYLPPRIIKIWQNQSFNEQAAINIKAELFSKMFVFIRQGELPFRILSIDELWLEDINEMDNEP